jgi:hypothetical protein
MDAEAIARELPAFPKPKSPEELPLPALGQPPLNPDKGAAPFADGESEAASQTEAITVVVSGLPRSGTSMLMQMLVAGGLEPLSDELRGADASNPRGYLEHERVKGLAQDNRWLAEARGKVIKVVAPLVPFMPQGEPYRVILMNRDLDEVVASQASMLKRLDRQGSSLDAAQLKPLLQQQLARAAALCQAHQVPVLVVEHREAIENPAAVAQRVAEFLGLPLDRKAMAAVVDPTLHRESTFVM